MFADCQVRTGEIPRQTVNLDKVAAANKTDWKQELRFAPVHIILY
jgi:hypothetical protein